MSKNPEKSFENKEQIPSKEDMEFLGKGGQVEAYRSEDEVIKYLHKPEKLARYKEEYDLAVEHIGNEYILDTEFDNSDPKKPFMRQQYYEGRALCLSDMQNDDIIEKWYDLLERNRKMLDKTNKALDFYGGHHLAEFHDPSKLYNTWLHKDGKDIKVVDIGLLDMSSNSFQKKLISIALNSFQNFCFSKLWKQEDLALKNYAMRFAEILEKTTKDKKDTSKKI